MPNVYADASATSFGIGCGNRTSRTMHAFPLHRFLKLSGRWLHRLVRWFEVNHGLNRSRVTTPVRHVAAPTMAATAYHVNIVESMLPLLNSAAHSRPASAPRLMQI